MDEERREVIRKARRLGELRKTQFKSPDLFLRETAASLSDSEALDINEKIVRGKRLTPDERATRGALRIAGYRAVKRETGEVLLESPDPNNEDRYLGDVAIATARKR